MSYQQMEFEVCRAIAGCVALLKRRREKKRGMNPMAYTVALSAALRVHNLTHPIYDILACVAKFQASGDRYATYPRITMALGCTYNNVYIHISRNPDFFRVDLAFTPSRVMLEPRAIELLGRIKERIDRTAGD